MFQVTVREMFEVHSEGTDRQIDQIASELYGLTDAGIRIVEESTKKQHSKI